MSWPSRSAVSPFADDPRLIQRGAPHRANLCLVWDAHVRRLRRSDPELFA